MTPAMVATARELAKVWTGPPLAQHVVSDGVPVYTCDDCLRVVSEDEAEGDWCPNCGELPSLELLEWVPSVDYPDCDEVIDLASDANGGIILGVIRVLKRPDGGPDYQLSMSPAWEESLGNWRIYLYTSKPEVWFHSDELAHLAALVFLAVPR